MKSMDQPIIITETDLSYQFEDIESVTLNGEFEDEYVYDIEVDDGSHTFIANDILVHNSVYLALGGLFKCMTPEYQKLYDTDRKKIDWLVRFSKEFIDKHPITPWIDIIRMRHVLVHGYYTASPIFIFDTYKNDLSVLRLQIESYILEKDL